MVEGEFKVRSLEAIDTIGQDADVGVIRVVGAHLKELGGRNALVRVCVVRNGRPVKSLVRIVRAKTTEPALKSYEIALRHEDRLAPGISRVGELERLAIKKAWQCPALVCFLLFHTSPLVKKETCIAVTLLILGAIEGFLLGFIVRLRFRGGVRNSPEKGTMKDAAFVRGSLQLSGIAVRDVPGCSRSGRNVGAASVPAACMAQVETSLIACGPATVWLRKPQRDLDAPAPRTRPRGARRQMHPSPRRDRPRQRRSIRTLRFPPRS